MDTSDPTVLIAADGVCNYCHEYDAIKKPRWHPDESGRIALEQQLEAVAQSTQHDQYQMVLGLSGGVDSSFLALKAKEWNLRILSVHVDAGWDTPEAVDNISRVVSHCGFEHVTVRPNWPTMRRLQLAFLRSGIINQDIPQDHAFFAGLYKTATRSKIRNVLSGSNVATEGLQSRAWGEEAIDSWLVRSIALGDRVLRLRGYPLIGFWEYYVVNPRIRNMEVLAPLNLMPYSGKSALTELEQTIGFNDYGSKHSESYFTRFYQKYYMPTRFGIDKRAGHLSSLVLSGEMSREAALISLTEPAYQAGQFELDAAYIADRLEISEDELINFAHMSRIPARRFITQQQFKRAIQRITEPVTGKRSIRPGVYR